MVCLLITKREWNKQEDSAEDFRSILYIYSWWCVSWKKKLLDEAERTNRKGIWPTTLLIQKLFERAETPVFQTLHLSGRLQTFRCVVPWSTLLELPETRDRVCGSVPPCLCFPDTQYSKEQRTTLWYDCFSNAVCRTRSSYFRVAQCRRFVIMEMYITCIDNIIV